MIETCKIGCRKIVSDGFASGFVRRVHSSGFVGMTWIVGHPPSFGCLCCSTDDILRFLSDLLRTLHRRWWLHKPGEWDSEPHSCAWLQNYAWRQGFCTAMFDGLRECNKISVSRIGSVACIHEHKSSLPLRLLKISMNIPICSSCLFITGIFILQYYGVIRKGSKVWKSPLLSVRNLYFFVYTF